MNKFTHNTARPVFAGVLAFCLSSAAFAGGLFGSIPATIRAANSGYELSAGTLSQNYVEILNGKTFDSESGSIPTYTVAFNGQGDHFGLGLRMNYTNGSDTYDGGVQNLSTGVITPYQGTTDNKMLDASVSLKLGFSPVRNLAIIPEAFVGRHAWDRTIQGPYGYAEDYYNKYSGVGASVDYQFRKFILSGDYKTGTTSNASMDSALPGTGTFNLGDHSWKSYGARITWEPNQMFSVFLAYSKTKFGYGKSVIDSAGYMEPDSTTEQSITSLGVVIF